MGIHQRVALTGLQPGTRDHFTAGTVRFPLATNSFFTVGLAPGIATVAVEEKTPGKARGRVVAPAPPARDSRA